MTRLRCIAGAFGPFLILAIVVAVVAAYTGNVQCAWAALALVVFDVLFFLAGLLHEIRDLLEDELAAHRSISHAVALMASEPNAVGQ